MLSSFSTRSKNGRPPSVAGSTSSGETTRSGFGSRRLRGLRGDWLNSKVMWTWRELGSDGNFRFIAGVGRSQLANRLQPWTFDPWAYCVKFYIWYVMNCQDMQDVFSFLLLFFLSFRFYPSFPFASRGEKEDVNDWLYGRIILKRDVFSFSFWFCIMGHIVGSWERV